MDTANDAHAEMASARALLGDAQRPAMMAAAMLVVATGYLLDAEGRRTTIATLEGLVARVQRGGLFVRSASK